MYLSPMVTHLIPIKDTTFMHVVGVVEIIAGIIVLTRWTKIGSYIVCAWLLGIAGNLITTGIFYDLALRDLEIAIGAFALSQLSTARERSVVQDQQAEQQSQPHWTASSRLVR